MENVKKIIDGKKYSEKFLKQVYPLSTNFYKNFKIQLEKNDRHTINYNFLN